MEAAPPETPAAAPSYDDPFAELDRISKAEEKPQDQPVKPLKAETEVPAEQVKPEEMPKKLTELRSSYEAMKKERDTLKAEIEAAKTAKNGKPDESERTALTEQLTTTEKRRQELETEMRFVRYEKSEEYKQKYEGPIASAFQSAYSDVSELQIETQEGARKATSDDFNAILKMPLQQAATSAKEWFGEAAGEVMAHRRRIHELNRERQGALDRFQKEGSEREQKATAQRAQHEEQMQRLWNESNEAAATKFPELFASQENDADGNELLKKGYQLADAAFGDGAQLSPEQRIRLHSMIRNKAAGFDRMVYRNRQLQTRLEAMEKELGEFRSSEPGKGEGAAQTGTQEESWEQELERISKSHA